MARQVMELLENINQAGTTIIMVTHDPELARRAQRNIQIVDGQVCDFTMYHQGHRHVSDITAATDIDKLVANADR
jgi:putative ABC transport system ATP-binding protein